MALDSSLPYWRKRFANVLTPVPASLFSTLQPRCASWHQPSSQHDRQEHHRRQPRGRNKTNWVESKKRDVEIHPGVQRDTVFLASSFYNHTLANPYDIPNLPSTPRTTLPQGRDRPANHPGGESWGIGGELVGLDGFPLQYFGTWYLGPRIAEIRQGRQTAGYRSLLVFFSRSASQHPTQSTLDTLAAEFSRHLRRWFKLTNGGRGAAGSRPRYRSPLLQIQPLRHTRVGHHYQYREQTTYLLEARRRHRARESGGHKISRRHGGTGPAETSSRFRNRLRTQQQIKRDAP